jgi:NADH-quinone oxidoreductase subunit M
MIFFTLANIAFPLTSGFLSEILTFLSLFHTNPYIGILASLAIILTPAYALYFTHMILYGSWSSHLLPTFDLSITEANLLFPLVFLTLFLGIHPKILFMITNPAIANLIP